jgi:hypothetical protein
MFLLLDHVLLASAFALRTITPCQSFYLLILVQ